MVGRAPGIPLSIVLLSAMTLFGLHWHQRIPIQEALSSIDSPAEPLNIANMLWPGSFSVDAVEPASRARFEARGRRYSVGVRPDGFALIHPQNPNEFVSIGFANAIADRVVSPSEPHETIHHIGKRSEEGRTTSRKYFKRVTFADIHPGVDVIYRAEEKSGDLEFDFVIHPGASSELIELVPGSGTRFARAFDNEDIVAANGSTRFRIKSPIAFQQINGQRMDVPVRANLVDGAIRFSVGKHDPSVPLTIDPLVTTYSTFLGTQGGEIINDLATDLDGNLYLAGVTGFDAGVANETGFPSTTDSLYLQNSMSSEDICSQCGFILKLDRDRRVIYGALLEWLEIKSVAIDLDGAAYATGHTVSSTFFPWSGEAFSNDPVGQAFALKLNPQGSALEYAALFAGTEGRAIAVDASGSAYVVGEVELEGLPTTSGSIQPSHQPSEFLNVDGFLLKIAPDGRSLAYGTYIGGTSHDSLSAIVLDADGSAVVAGQSASTDLVGYPGENRGQADAMILRISQDGSRIESGLYLGGAEGDFSNAISDDGHGGFLVGGATESVDFPVTAGVVQARILGQQNGWVARVSATMSIRYVTYFGGSILDGVTALTTDPEGNAYIVGTTFSGDLLTTADGFQDMSAAYTASGYLNALGKAFYPQSHHATREAYFAVIDNAGAGLLYGTYLGGYFTVPRGWPPLTFGSSVARGADGTIYVAGRTDTASFPTTDNGMREQMGGTEDAFLVAFASQEFAVTSPTQLPRAEVDVGYEYALQASRGTAPYRWELVGFKLPDGLLFSDNGVISGTPATSQSEVYGYQFTVKVTDAEDRTAYKSLFIDVGYPGQSVCASGVCSANLLVGQPHLQTFPFLARGVPPYQIYVWGEVPPGFIVNDSNATIGGVPSAAGIYDFSVEMLDSLGKRDTVSWRVTVTDTQAPSPPPSPPPVPPSTRPPTSNGGGGGGGTVEIATLIMLMLLTTLRALSITTTDAKKTRWLRSVVSSRSSE